MPWVQKSDAARRWVVELNQKCTFVMPFELYMNGAVGCLFIRMSWEDDMDDEVVVGGMILEISFAVNRKSLASA